MKTLTLVLLGSLALCNALEANASQAFRCFSKFYSANRATIQINGEVAANNKIDQVSVVDDTYGLNFRGLKLAANPNYRPSTYVNYNQYLVGKVRGLSSTIALLLPNNLQSLQGRFDGYVSDPLADNSGSDGYFKVVCEKR